MTIFQETLKWFRGLGFKSRPFFNLPTFFIIQLESEKALQDMQFSHNTPKLDLKKVSLKRRPPKMLDRNYQLNLSRLLESRICKKKSCFNMPIVAGFDQ